MSFNGISDIINAELNGSMRNYAFRKNPSQTTTQGLWFDLSSSAGNPTPKYWFDAPPLIAKAVYQSTDGGLFHGADVSPHQKIVRILTTQATVVTALPMDIRLCDYLLYYPSIDEGTTDTQTLDNTITLPRYESGEGVMAIAITVASRTGGRQFYITYTNSEGIAGRTSQVCTQNSSSAIGTICTSATATQASGNPFIGLQSGDKGIRSIESVNMLGTDVGLFALVLVKPILQTQIKEITAPVEKDLLAHASNLPIVQDNAFLNFLCLPNGTLASTGILGYLKVVWN